MTPLNHDNPGTYDPDASENSEDNSNSNNSQTEVIEDEKSLLKLVMTAAATSATLGYDVGIMAAAIQPLETQMNLNGVQKEVRKLLLLLRWSDFFKCFFTSLITHFLSLSFSLQKFAMGSLNFFAAFGALLGGHIADKSGRKATIKCCAWLFVVGTLLMALAVDYAMMLLGRIVTGIGVGVAFVVAPVFITEVAPADKRGELNSVFDVAINGGILAGYISGFVIQLISPDNWRLMLGCGLILPVLVLMLLASLPESPRWLMLVHQKPAALHVLQQLGNTPAQAQQMIREMEQELQLEKQMPTVLWGPGQKLAVGLGFWQQITGTEAVLYYSADFLSRAGMTSPKLRLLGNCFVGICKLVPEYLAMHHIDSVGRRPLLMGSAITLVISISSLSFAFYMEAPAVVVVVLLCCIMASFSIGLGPFTFLCASENLGVSERATGMTYCAAANRCTSGMVALSAVSLYELLGDAKLFGLYALFGIGSLWFYWTVPETSGQSLEELSQARHALSRSSTMPTTYDRSDTMDRESRVPYTDREEIRGIDIGEHEIS